MEKPRYTYDQSLKTPVRPIKAFRHFRNLVANKEDTSQVFHIITALNGNSFQKSFLKFANSEAGYERLQQYKFLPPQLDDHEALRQLPTESLGQAYLHFMESQGLTAQGLVEEFDRFGHDFDMDDYPADMIKMRELYRDTHDLLHVLTGYSRDALGEACVLAFSYAQHGGPGVAFIAFMAGLEIKKTAPKAAPVMRAVREGYRLGKAAKDICYEDIMALMELPLSDVRERLNVRTPEIYFQVHDAMRAKGIDPFEVIGQPAAA